MSSSKPHAAARHSNRLARETSPYLLQHAHNPVDWYPWGAEALERARREDKPILLSIGYSACHWCHVMERESFENEGIAALMNELFVCIKVDREERPDLDHVYMNAVQALTGHGGWPLTVFLTPAGEPFYGGTYYPPVERHGMPAFTRVLQGVAQAYREKPADVRRSVAEILEVIARIESTVPAPEPLPPDLPLRAAQALARHYDVEHGGLGGAPKFPNTMAFSLFLRAWHASGDESFRRMVAETLHRMAAGGIYDQLGGGFHRYAVDAQWLVPHFEKMLYDNALLARLYIEGYQATGDQRWRRIAEETLAYVAREMTHPEGAFYAAQDADSEGVEGRYFVWTRDEVMRALGEERGEILCRFYDVTEEGNFERQSILHQSVDIGQLSRLFDRPGDDIAALVEEGRGRLLELRGRRVPPMRDDKILTGWNALMIGACAEAYKAFGDPRYRRMAERALAFVFERLNTHGRLMRIFKDGESRIDAYLDDHAFLLNAVVDLYEGTFDPALIERACALADALLELFEDGERGGFFFTGARHEELVHRPVAGHDGPIPSGNSAAAMGLLRLYHYRGDIRLLDAAERTFRRFTGVMREQPFVSCHMLAAADFHQRGPDEIVLVGRRDDPDVVSLLARIHGVYLPNKTLIVTDPEDKTRPPAAEGKVQVDGRVTTYVCRGSTCSPPATSWPALAALLSLPQT